MQRNLSQEADIEIAVAEIERLQPEVVWIDLHMPKINGFAVPREVKRRFQNIRVAVLTIDASPLVRQRCTNLHANPSS